MKIDWEMICPKCKEIVTCGFILFKEPLVNPEHHFEFEYVEHKCAEEGEIDAAS